MWNRPLLHVELTLPDGRSLHVINLHLRAPLAVRVPEDPLDQATDARRAVEGWPKDLVAAMKRSGQALEARLLVDQLFERDPKALIVVAGDLNAEPHETPVRLLTAEAIDTGNPALALRSLADPARSLRPDQRYSAIYAGRRMLVDHVLLSPALSGGLRAIEIHNESVIDDARESRILGSSHAPVLVEVEV